MICCSVALYALAKVHGPKEARNLLRTQLAAPDESSLPCVRTIARLRELDDVQLWPDFGGANPAKMRTRAAHAAWVSGADVWISCDDDVEAPGETLRALHEAVAADDPAVPAVCIAPCILRGSDVVNVGVKLDLAMPVRMLQVSGGQAIACLGGGFGLVAVNRLALQRIRDAHADLAFVDDDGEEKIGLFLEELTAKRWWGEDLTFFRRLPKDVRVECLIQGATSHEGQMLDLSSLPDRKRLDLSSWDVPATARIEVEVIQHDEPPTRPDVESHDDVNPPAAE